MGQSENHVAFAKDDDAVEEAHAEIEMLNYFKRDLGSFGRACTFLSCIFDYRNS